MHRLSLFFPFAVILLLIIGCGDSKPKQWQRMQPITEKLDHPQAFAADGENLYFVTGGTIASKNEGTNNVLKIPLGGAVMPQILFKGGDLIPDPNALVVDDTHIYFSATGLRKISKKGGEISLLTKAFMASEIVLDKENIYWMPFVGEGMSPAPIYSISKNGGEVKTLTDARPSANGLSVDEKYVYWIQTDGLYKTSKQGGNVEKIYSSPNDQITSDLKIDAENFYFLQGASKRDLFAVRKAGGEAKLLAKSVTRFWPGENDIVFQRYIASFDVALLKIGKDGTNEIELDRDGYLADLIVIKNKIYLSDVSRIYVLSY